MLDIIFEDNDIIVLNKPAGVAVQTKNLGLKDLQSEVLKYLANKKPYLGIVHRLDQPVSGIVVFAKNEKAAANLSKQFQDGRASKEYAALVSFSPNEDMPGLDVDNQEITLTDYLIKDGKNNVSRVVSGETAGAKKSVLSYRILKVSKSDGLAKLLVTLKTGRHHQIRCQLSHANMPIVNDIKYGGIQSEDNRISRGSIALCAHKLSFFHPSTGKSVSFTIDERF